MASLARLVCVCGASLQLVLRTESETAPCGLFNSASLARCVSRAAAASQASFRRAQKWAVVMRKIHTDDGHNEQYFLHLRRSIYCPLVDQKELQPVWPGTNQKLAEGERNIAESIQVESPPPIQVKSSQIKSSLVAGGVQGAGRRNTNKGSR